MPRAALVDRWLLALCRPDSPSPSLPRGTLDHAGLLALCRSAEMHGVLPAVLKHLACIPGADAAALAPARHRLAERCAITMFLSAESARLVGALAAAGIDAVTLKGADFASRLYPPSLRLFGDIDLLVGPSDLDRVPSVLQSLGYQEKHTPLKYQSGYAERSWQHPSMPGGTAEVHQNLVNSPTIQRGVSVTRDDLPLNRDAHGRPSPSPAAMLLIAAVHGAASHGFDKLQHLNDIAQAALGRAGPVDAPVLRRAIAQTGASLAVAAGLDLAARTLREPACGALLEQLDLSWPKQRVRVLITPAVVVRAQGPRRWRSSWRRQWLRRMLKHQRPA